MKGKALSEIFKRFQEKNNPDNKTHKDHVIERYSLIVMNTHGEKFKAIPVCLIDDFVKDYNN